MILLDKAAKIINSITFLRWPTHQKLLILLLLFSFLIRVYRIDMPQSYVFDEYYHVYTAKLYLTNPQLAWDWWLPARSPDNSGSNSWDNPPLGKEIMAMFMLIFDSFNPIIYRLPGVLAGIFCLYLIYRIGLHIFKSPYPALIAAYLFSLDTLNFVLSRTGMLDTYVLLFILASLLSLLKNHLYLASFLFGLALASKWTAIYFLLFYLYYIMKKNQDHIKVGQTLGLLVCLFFSYLLSFIPFFLIHPSLYSFINYNRDIIINQLSQTNASNITSPWWSWIFSLHPIEFFRMSSPSLGHHSIILAIGNLPLQIEGLIALIIIFIRSILVKSKEQKIWLPIVGILIFWIPWVLLNRVTYIYYFHLSIPFLCLILGYCIHKIYLINSYALVILFMLMLPTLTFFLYYPLLTALPVSDYYLNLIGSYHLR